MTINRLYISMPVALKVWIPLWRDLMWFWDPRLFYSKEWRRCTFKLRVADSVLSQTPAGKLKPRPHRRTHFLLWKAGVGWVVEFRARLRCGTLWVWMPLNYSEPHGPHGFQNNWLLCSFGTSRAGIRWTPVSGGGLRKDGSLKPSLVPVN